MLLFRTILLCFSLIAFLSSPILSFPTSCHEFLWGSKSSWLHCEYRQTITFVIQVSPIFCFVFPWNDFEIAFGDLHSISCASYSLATHSFTCIYLLFVLCQCTPLWNKFLDFIRRLQITSHLEMQGERNLIEQVMVSMPT